jgi:L-ribulose-5-phosphate 3-epimerase
MNRIALGIVLETTGLPVRLALSAIAKVEVRGVQADGIGELAPDSLSETGRRELRTLLRGNNLELTALNCPIRRSLDDPDNLQARLEQIVKVMQLAVDLGPRTIIVPLASLPTAEETLKPRALTLRESLTYLGQHADRLGATVALEAGLDGPQMVREYLATFDSGSLAINFDPANFLINGHKADNALSVLHDKIAHINARDARARTESGGPKEVPLGAGDIDWLMFAAILESIGYRKFVVVDQEHGKDRWPEVVAGANFLKRFFPTTP